MAESSGLESAQALAFKGFARLERAHARWLRIADLAQARRALRSDVLPRVEFGAASRGERTTAVQIAFSGEGLRRLGAPEQALDALGRPFARGIGEPHRSRALGDVGANDPSAWRWDDRRAHLVLLAYAESERAARSVADELTAGAAFESVAELDLRTPADGREPFGFRDGLAQPRVARGGESALDDTLAPGEVLLGRVDASGQVAAAPSFGVDGSFLVLRELEQDVAGFWNDWFERASDAREMVWLAAKAVGRWPNGMPAHGSTPCSEPALDERAALAPLSFRDDPHGDQVPRGAHIRRAHPRDGLFADAERSLAASARHRLLRRGRIFGPDVPRLWWPWTPEGASATRPVSSDGASRGLLFACLCSDLARQFEFVQQTWLNHPKHADLFDEVDPIAAGAERGAGFFSIPRDPLRLRLRGLAARVTVRAGGYFFLPARGALDAWLG